MALVALSRIKQRDIAVRLVMDGASVSEVGAEAGRVASVGACVGAALSRGGIDGPADRPHRRVSCPRRASAELEAVVCELRCSGPREQNG